MLRTATCTVWLLCSLGGNAQEADVQESDSNRGSAAAGSNVSSQSLPEEIIVIGRDVLELQQRVYAAEDRVYAMFNELNDDDLYDIHCRMHAPLGTRIKERLCTPNFLDDATREEALGFLEGRAYTPPTAVISYHAPILQEKMKELVLGNPEFFDAIDEHRLLREALDERTNRGSGE